MIKSPPTLGNSLRCHILTIIFNNGQHLTFAVLYHHSSCSLLNDETQSILKCICGLEMTLGCAGCLAEVTDVLGPLCEPYAEALLSVVLKELAAAADDANCRNAAFCAGLLAIHAPTVVQPHLPRLLQVFHPPTLV